MTDTPAEVAVTRFEPEQGCYNCLGGSMWEYEQGEYVRYEDHARIVADLQSQLAAQRERDGRLCALLEAAIGPAGADFCMNPELEADIDAALKDSRP
jgi:hypothetical protein